ncbi:PD-(D/E)XK nuclease family protein [Streptomyces sp. NPDC006692]|uniref:PD-(D/E)XK nuclease family protein n=1 Tax=Streptomyces sp. NPDC006692 TaxID=3364758 RepID=UPI00367D2317
MTIEQWQRPAGMLGNGKRLRVGPGAIGEEEYTCPAFSAAKVRPDVRPQHWPSMRKPQLEDFTLGPVNAALDRIEFNGVAIELALGGLLRTRPPLHPGLQAFARHAVRMYLRAAADSDGQDEDAVPHYWVVQETDDEAERSLELYAWGRRYQSPSGRTRRHRFLRFSVHEERERDPAQVAIAAYAAAFGSAASWPQPWSVPFQLRGATVVERVVVEEVNLADGCLRVLFDGTLAEAAAAYVRSGKPQVEQLAAGGRARPGSSCTGCKQLTVCTELPRTPGLLGVPAPRAPRRKVSISDLRYYRACPAQAHLRSLNLPKTYEYGPAAELGQAVHAWLERLHRRGNGAAPPPCMADDMPDGEAAWSVGRWTVSGDLARIGVTMLRHHVEHCPFTAPDGITKVEVEPTRAFHDTSAQSIVIAKPDLLYLDEGSWVWRELKTTQSTYVQRGDPLEVYPQLALAAVLLHHGGLGGDPAGSRVELEVLRPSGPEITVIDPAESVAKARDVLHALAQPWREDEQFQARPSRECQRCPVSRWCPSRELPEAMADAAPDDKGGTSV